MPMANGDSRNLLCFEVLICRPAGAWNDFWVGFLQICRPSGAWEQKIRAERSIWPSPSMGLVHGEWRR